MVSILERDLASANEIDQAQTAYTIFRIAPERAAGMVSKLSNLLNITNPIAQLRAATYLGFMGSEARPAVPILKTGIGRPNVMGTWGSSVRDRNIDALMRIDKSELNSEAPRWVADLSDHNPEIRREAMHLLLRLGPASRSALPELKTLLTSDPLRLNRRAAIQALSQIGEPKEIVPVLIEALSDPDTSVQWAATVALVDIEPATETIPAMMDFLSSDTATTQQRKAAIRVLGKRKSARYVVQFAHALKDIDPMIRRAAIAALGSIEPKTEETLAALRTALNDSVTKNRTIATTALEN